ncbi:NADH-dependent flavin oxidoreductase [Levilactobacillus brevis]|uniref:NADH-dependent flavin oxidoreductase n=1 Tax=Levilactobacillus brevis TaxID=1580 RepID=UPI001C1E911D|nr:NADH-dependent flavin oxidoreductase [Levilactobacillus brevis]MBU7539068.1 NADH-dependent flavin oxidoreductase [Levilactobacillus brevis]MBU7565254.1 NADH-dependent flavin oxidoreductase [Levilactobacillus brevis]MCE6012129.1 NADH-dependent flavin oxidoreductase [Levilactobacillus brevis]MCE6014503.1 NADH-dependent flavin oxidoreductase [Levilactobacillus brevis]MCE6016900.1 NADH-dependent flavin oxidoreductase [Levilactobacillus brevis]
MTYQFMQPYTFKNGVTLKNRMVMSPTTTMSSFYDGHVTNDEIKFYDVRAGGPEMIIGEVANVIASGKGFEGELSIADDGDIDGLSRLANAMKRGGTKAILQIFHAGRKSNDSILRGEQPVSASAVKAVFPSDSQTPRELAATEIDEIIVAFGEATRRAIAAGFDGVELHGANTYLLQQFFSPNSNRRTDKWGGDREARMGFAKAVIASVQQAIDTYADRPFLLGYRISPEEIETPGIRLADSLAFVDMLGDSAVDYVHTSMGSAHRTSLNDKTDHEPILKQLVQQLAGRKPLIGVGSVEKPTDAEAVLTMGADLVAMGREFIREPQWVEKVVDGDEASIRYQISPSELDELAIPRAMQDYLKGAFYSVMHFTTDPNVAVDYQNEAAPMEGFEKKMS